MEEKIFFNGQWKAVEKLGEGSFGIVYKAIKEQYGVESYSAIKQIKIPQTDEYFSKLKSQGMTQSDIEKSYDSQVKKWVEEIQFLNQFKDNENIVSIEDFEVLERNDKPGRTINIRMELLQNIDDHVMDRTITDKKVLKMASDILKALEECEEKNVVHRDIKPENVFVNSRGTYKLGDFGEAKSIEKTVSNMSKKGTENYMAPEIYKGERGSRSVDTYSLGIMLYKYFNNNRLPFIPDYPNPITFEDMESAIEKRMSGEEMKPPVKASNNIARIILKACSYKTNDRYKSAMEFRNDIEEELRAITNPIKLFDFQEGEIEKDNSISEFGKTVGIFEDNTNSKTNLDRTFGIFEDEQQDKSCKEIEEKNVKENKQPISRKTEINNSSEAIKESYVNSTIENATLTSKHRNYYKKTIITIITIIAALIIAVIVKNIISNIEQDDGFIVEDGMKKVVIENLRFAVNDEFGTDYNGYLSFQDDDEDSADGKCSYNISYLARAIKNLVDECHQADTYLESRKKSFSQDNSKNTFKYTYGDLQSIEINGNLWYKIEEMVTYESTYNIDVAYIYAIVYDDILYEIEFNINARSTKEKIEKKLSFYDNIIKTLTLNKNVSKDKKLGNLKIKIPSELEFYENGWYICENKNKIYYCVGLDFLKNDQKQDYIDKCLEASDGENIKVSEVETEKINGIDWSKLILTKEVNNEHSIDYVYLISNENTYIVTFRAITNQKSSENDIDLKYFEKMMKNVKRTLKYE